METLKIALSGAQGSGKSTMLAALEQSTYLRDLVKSPNYGPIEFLPEIVRDIKRRYNFKINEHGTLDTEMMVMTTHLQNLIARPRFVTDRCLVDNWIYAQLNEKPLPKEYMVFDTWLVERMVEEYDLIFYIPNEFDPPDDGVRNLDPVYFAAVKRKFEEEYTRLMETHDNIIRLTGTIVERIGKMEAAIRQLVLDKVPF